MALITCPECGKQVSDRASQCPNCGIPLQPSVPAGVIPPPPPVIGMGQPTNAAPSNPTPTTSAPPSELSASALKCPHCKSTLGPKDLLSKDWAKCPQCGNAVLLGGGQNAFDDNLIIERLAKFTTTKEWYHQFFMQKLMDDADIDVFDNLKIISQKRKYFWAREYGQAKERAIFPMCQYGKKFFEELSGKPYMLLDDYEKYFHPKDMVPFNSDDIRDTEVIAKEQSASENRYEFSHTDIGSYMPTPAYYCLPVMEEVVEYKGKQYTFIGTSSCAKVTYTIGDFPTAGWLKGEPNFTEMKPVTWTVTAILILLLLIMIFAIFSQSFWFGIFSLIIMAVIGYYVGTFIYGAIWLVTSGIDIIIRGIVNRIIRNKFRNRWEECQEHKRLAAKKNFKLDLTYVVPEFSIPYINND